MALDPAELLRSNIPDEPAGAPLAGTRPQAMQRLQIGLCGVAAMVLLVGLADIIISNAQRNEAQVVPEAATPAEEEDPERAPARDPLADAGVVPNMPEPAPTQRPAAPAPGADADPDPDLAAD